MSSPELLCQSLVFAQQFDEHGCDKWLTEPTAVKSRSETGKETLFLSEMVAVELLRDSGETTRQLFWGRRSRQVADEDPEDLQDGKTAA